MKASAIGDEVVFTYPVSSSPSPLNIMPLEVARVVLGPQNTPLVIFTNGEVHSLDMTTGSFTLKHRLISDAQALGVSFPAATTAQVYDPASNVLYSVLTAGMYAYLATTAFETHSGHVLPQQQPSSWLELDAGMFLDPGVDAVTTDFSTQTFTNALLIRLDDTSARDTAAQDTAEPRVLLTAQSLNDAGFDQLLFVNLTTGKMDAGPVQSLMDYDMVFKCQPNNCDLNRVSTYDRVSGRLFYQAHMAGSDPNTVGNIAMGEIGFSKSHVTDGWTWYVQTVSDDAPFGYNAFQFYNF